MADAMHLFFTVRTAAGLPVCEHLAGREPVSRPCPPGDVWPANELSRCVERAEKEEDASSARRAAELFELIEDDENAKVWWHRAANLGDPDAIDYVREILVD